MGPMEAQFFAYCQMQGLETVSSGDISKAFKLTPKQERDLLYRLASDGWIIRLRRGLYLVSRKLPAGGIWMPGEALILEKLMEDCRGRYQLCGPNAFNFWGFDDQVPNRVYAYNNRLSGERNIGGLSFTFIKVGEKRLGATVREKTAAGNFLVVGSKARALMDAVYDWKRFNGIPRGYEWIREEVRRDRDMAIELARVCREFGNQGTVRRIGFILKNCGAEDRVLRDLRGCLRSSSLIPLLPERPKRGRIDREWGVINNAV
jgi:predicted transcriptional regulator of viral defense system